MLNILIIYCLVWLGDMDFSFFFLKKQNKKNKQTNKQTNKTKQKTKQKQKNMENIFDSRFEVFSQSEFEVITAATN